MKLDLISLCQILQKIKSRELTCIQLAEHFIENIVDHSKLNSTFYFNEKEILDDAYQLDKKAENGSFAGRLHGAPLIIKDNIHVKGVPNTAGTPSLASFVPKKDAQVINTLRNEGALFMGKANMHELSLGVTSNNAKYGPCKNSKNIFYSSGGSSGGTGTAVGDRLVPAGLGTDTIGSVRIPCSVNGISGLRPTHLRYPNYGVTPVASSCDTIGPMARYVEDLILLDEVITGESFDQKPMLESNNLSGIRLGISSDYLCSALHPDVETAFENAKKILQQNGATLIEVDSKSLKNATDDCSIDYLMYEFNQDLSQYLVENDINISLEDINKQIASPDVKQLFQEVLNKGGKTKTDFIEFIHVKRLAVKRAYQEMFCKYNLKALVFPTLSCLPVRIDQIKEDTMKQFLRNLYPGSQAG